MLKAQSLQLPATRVWAAFFAAVFYALVTFGRVGEFFRVEVLMERGIGLGRSLSSCVFDRFIDVLMLLTLGGALGAWVLGAGDMAFIFGAVFLLGSAMAVVVLFGGQRRYLPRFLVDHFIQRAQNARPGSLMARLGQGWVEFSTSSRDLLRFRALAEALILTALSWAGYFACVCFLANGFGIEASLQGIITATSLSALATLLPITVQGVGTRELIFAAVLGIENVAQEAAVALSLTILGVMFFTSLLMGLLGLLWRARQRRHDGLAQV